MTGPSSAPRGSASIPGVAPALAGGPRAAGRALRILIVDDSPEDAQTYQRLLTRATGFTATCTAVELGEDGLAAMRAERPDCVLLDYHLPDMTGVEFLRGCPPCPVVMLTGVGDESVAVSAITAGAQDYLVKGALSSDTLALTVLRAIDRHQLQQALAESRQRMEGVLASVDDALIALDGDLKVLYMNAAGCALVGCTDDPASSLPDLAPWLFGPELLATCREVLDSGERRAAEHFVPERQAWLDVRAHPSAGGLTLTVRDVTRRRHEDEQLRLLQSVAVNSRDAIIISEADQITLPGPRIMYVNAAFTRMTGYTPQEVQGRTPRILQGPDTDPAVRERIRDRLTRWQPVDETVKNYRKDGTPFWVHLSITPVADERGWVTHWVSVQRDVTEVLRREQQERARRETLELVAAGRPVEDVLHRICTLLGVDLSGLTVTAWLRDGPFLTVKAMSNAVADPVRVAQLAGVGHVPLNDSRSFIAAAVRSGQRQVIPDVTAPDVTLYPGARDVITRHGLRALWVQPVPSTRPGELPLGAFTVFSAEARSPKARELAALEDAAALASLILERMLAQREIERLAMSDALTGLPNRSRFLEHLHDALQGPVRSGERLGVALLDLDRFKTINDTLGHSAGDALLIQVARRLRLAFAPEVTVARMGGDEFTLLLPVTHDTESFRRNLSAQLHGCFKAAFEVGGQEVFIEASLGVAIAPDHGLDGETLLSAADMAMYSAKRSGRGVTIHDPQLELPDPTAVSLHTDLYRALERGELELHYQPVLHAGTRALHGAEALIRWRHPRLGLVSPGQFIPMAENSGLIVPIGAWVLREACAQLVRWQVRAPDLTVSVNLSPRQFWQPDLVDVVADILAETGAPARNVTLEITESVLMDVPNAEATLRGLRALGVGLSLDDFGTGYSSLSYLHRFPLSAVKIDRSFVTDVTGAAHGTSETLVQGVMLLAHTLQLTVTTEGIETPEQAAFVESIGGELLQGYLLGRPVPAAAFEPLLPG